MGLPEHLTKHLVTMAELNRAGRYDRHTDGVERVTGRPAMSVREFVGFMRMILRSSLLTGHACGTVCPRRDLATQDGRSGHMMAVRGANDEHRAAQDPGTAVVIATMGLAAAAITTDGKVKIEGKSPP